MKVLHVSPSYFPAVQFGGPIQSVHSLNKELVNQGINVDVFTTNAGLDPKEFNNKKWHSLDNVQIKYFSFIGYIHYNFSISLLLALLRNVKKYDIVHITAVWNFPVWAASIACRWHKTPYIISPRGTIYPETIAIKSANFKKIYFSLIAKKCLERSRSIHFTALDEEVNVKKYLNLNVASVVIPNGIRMEDFIVSETVTQSVFPFKDKKPYILFLGRINYKKGLDILFKAFSEIRKANIDLQLVVVGPDNDNYKSELEILASELGILKFTVFTGQLEGEAKLNMYRNAFCFALPSYSENFGMSVVEAMACNCPVVISNKVGIFQDISNNEAGLVTNTNHIEVSKAIIQLFNDHSLKNKIQKNGLQMVEKMYSIQGVAKQFIHLYQALSK